MFACLQYLIYHDQIHRFNIVPIRLLVLRFLHAAFPDDRDDVGEAVGPSFTSSFSSQITGNSFLLASLPLVVRLTAMVMAGFQLQQQPHIGRQSSSSCPSSSTVDFFSFPLPPSSSTSFSHALSSPTSQSAEQNNAKFDLNQPTMPPHNGQVKPLSSSFSSSSTSASTSLLMTKNALSVREITLPILESQAMWLDSVRRVAELAGRLDLNINCD